ncbi:MAG: malonic semialdehyde reductase [Actinobacteria bacterium 13_1_20CM_3_71_11]|nr:MAG: malonic semialdehyde reductase [Actinobacteria bacterium 13_1_20CM_3_71_11]TML29820.1 MAG: malonic semialdehyde reductase [Actinomycetota bacterium]
MTAAPVTRTALALAPEAQDLLFRQARTANTFTDEPVTDEQIEAIYDLVKFGPTSINCQPLRVVLVRSEQARARLVPHMAESNQAKTRQAPLVAILAADTEFHDELPRLVPFKPEARDWFLDPTMREHAARFNAGLQIGYFIIGIRAAGLAAGPMIGFDAAGVDAEFFPDGRYRSLLVVNIGLPGPDAWFDRLPRLPHDEVVTTV